MMCRSQKNRRSAPLAATVVRLLSSMMMMMMMMHLPTIQSQPIASPSSSTTTIPPGSSLNRNYDRFNYVATTQDATHYDFGPEDWANVQCPDLATCEGWADKFEFGKGWDLYQGGNCLWCPAGDDRCEDSHHESPINLLRARAITTDAEYNECIDVHWMQYHDSSCSFDQLQAQNGFRIERHALKIVQPIVLNATGYYVLNCQTKGKSWGRIDFSRGFSAWWYLSHVDLHVPSEHVQEGKRYDAEIQMYHFYSKSGVDAGVDNEMGTLLIFLQVYDDAPDYDVLNKLICAWREVEHRTRTECGLEPIASEYPGCVSFASPTESTSSGGPTTEQQQRQQQQQDAARNLRSPFTATAEEAAELLRDSIPYEPQQQQEQQQRQRHSRTAPVSAYDIILQNHLNLQSNTSYQPMKIGLDPDYHIVDPNSFDWETFIAKEYEKDAMKSQPGYHHHHGRELMNYEHVGPFHNYFPMIGCRTEYYYRYSGTQTIPPCHGRFESGQSRRNTNHWRAMKDPIRISQRQLLELHRLLRERIAPLDDPINQCQPDTAGKVDPTTNLINVARPLQQNAKPHYTVFCECTDWISQWTEDQNWCLEQDQLTRFYQTPYNFPSIGF